MNTRNNKLDNNTIKMSDNYDIDSNNINNKNNIPIITIDIKEAYDLYVISLLNDENNINKFKQACRSYDVPIVYCLLLSVFMDKERYTNYLLKIINKNAMEFCMENPIFLDLVNIEDVYRYALETIERIQNGETFETYEQRRNFKLSKKASEMKLIIEVSKRVFAKINKRKPETYEEYILCFKHALKIYLIPYGESIYMGKLNINIK